MNTPESLNGLHTKLISMGLPAEYAQRAATEIADHYCDLVTELEATGAARRKQRPKPNTALATSARS
jgi:hypothetical protein